MLDETDLILEKFQSAIKDIKDKQQLEKIKVDYLGKNGLITNEMRKISSAPYQFKKNHWYQDQPPEKQSL